MSGTRITITKMIGAPSQKVWVELSDIESHVEWMADAVALEFHSEQRSGIGTSFSCRTKIGPFFITDEMVIDQWREGTAVGVTHSGAVTGSGTFELKDVSASETLVTWSEVLVFPWWMAGKIGSTIARPIFGWIWNRNLSRLSDRVLQK